MKIIHDVREWKDFCAELRKSGSIGFVPTMGALHEGHLSLVRRARLENDYCVASIFVNPAQFNDKTDLEKYPRMPERDSALFEAEGVTAIFMPDAQAMYPDGYRYKVSEAELSARYCGAKRPGHFDGVLSVVLKLLLLTGADRAYFGEKDYQQYMLIRGMAEAFFLDTLVVPCALIRETDGLAMSSRNLRLGAEARKKAPLFSKALAAASVAEASRMLEAEGFTVEYIEELRDETRKETRRLAAVWLDGVRLIDNIRTDS